MPKKLDITKLKKDFKKTEELVYWVLQNFPETRSSDKLLMLTCWELQGWRLSPAKQAFFYKVASPSTILRARRKIQEKGDFLPDGEKIARRTLLGMATREMFRKEKE